MYSDAAIENRLFARFSRVCGLLGALGLLATFLISQPCSAQEPEKEGLGLIISGKAGAEDVGLPIYAGSKLHKDNSDDSAAARLGLWGGGSGFKLAVLKMDTNDSPEKVAAFYKKALAKYGKVLDCSNPSPAQPNAEKKDDILTCGDDKPDKGGLLFKSGTKQKQHIVGIQPNGQGTFYQLVALGDWKSADKN
jgi:hypothetical protein